MDEEKKGLKAKAASLNGQIIAAVWVGTWNAAQFIRDIRNGGKIAVLDIIISGFAIGACFAPVYFNLFMDKIAAIKNGGTNGPDN